MIFSFTINLRTGREEAHPIAMHLAVRFQGLVAVFNNKDHGKWGSEVQMKDNFPFKRGVHADIAILCTTAGFAVSHVYQNLIYRHLRIVSEEIIYN